jgi:hypothetical protein
LVLADGVYENLLLVVGNLVDDILDLSVAAAEFLECGNALILDLNSVGGESTWDGKPGNVLSRGLTPMRAMRHKD